MALRQMISCRQASSWIFQSSLFQRKLNLPTLQRQNTFIRFTKNVRKSDSFTSKRTQIIPSPVEGLSVDAGGYIDPSKLWRALGFTIAFSAGSFATVTIWEYETIRARALNEVWKISYMDWLKSKINNGKQDWEREVKLWWKQLSPGEKIFTPICAANVLVFALWRIPRLTPVMMKYFISNPAARVFCWPMVLSTFSHYSMFHIFANMYVLHSFSHLAVATLGREQFLGFYLSAGVVASLASNAFKTIIKQPGLSLGASGAIMGILAYVCTKYPDTQLSILFLPMVQFSAASAIKVIMGVDLVGVLMGWKVFDHAAHLGGALCGLFWSYYGSRYLWPKREYLIRHWHEFRGPPSK